ncbi:multisubunit sodium/proton antiporter MrpB subunit [Neorhizobium sp. R1-B]|jgi:multicomponent Na+:H+ antiporter subunit B|nr:multisubunit sodium/proton antiporter MrpB subunit [Neorhizobium sp. R1-B]
MNTLILRTVAPVLTALMLLFSVFVLLRGHNEPGGGFIGGLIAASALAIYGIAFGVSAVRRAIRFHPMAIAGAGLLLAALSGLISIFAGVPFMTGLWIYPEILGVEVPVATVMSFDIGVYLVVVGAITSIALALEQEESEPAEAIGEQPPPVRVKRPRKPAHKPKERG